MLQPCFAVVDTHTQEKGTDSNTFAKCVALDRETWCTQDGELVPKHCNNNNHNDSMDVFPEIST